MSKDERCTCKACKNTVFHCLICNFVVFLLPSSSWLPKLPNYTSDTSLVLTENDSKNKTKKPHCNISVCKTQELDQTRQTYLESWRQWHWPLFFMAYHLIKLTLQQLKSKMQLLPQRKVSNHLPIWIIIDLSLKAMSLYPLATTETKCCCATTEHSPNRNHEGALSGWKCSLLK